VSLKFDTPKEWLLTRFLHEKLIKDLEEKIFHFHQAQALQAKKKNIQMMGYTYEKSAAGEGATQDKNREQNLIFEFAEELFKCWDQADDGYIPAHLLSKHLVDLGLATNREFVYRMIGVILRRPQAVIP
jgi:hypothetical protein